MIDRDNITRVFLQNWGKSSDEANIQFYSRKWWVSYRNKSFRLTLEGLEFLTKTLDIRSYVIPFTESIDKSPQTMIYLARFIDSPFYLTNTNITVFSEIKSFELILFSDDIRKYGIIKSLNHRKSLL